MKIVLIGFACCYKSSVGKLLAKKLNYPHVDTDKTIEELTGKSVADIFAIEGEATFRQTENDVLLKAAACDNAVISCGGGSALLFNFKQLADDSTVVWLTAQADTVLSRLGDTPRPLFDGKTVDEIATIIDSRKPCYAKYADVTIATDGLTSQQVADIAYKQLFLK